MYKDFWILTVYHHKMWTQGQQLNTDDDSTFLEYLRLAADVTAIVTPKGVDASLGKVRSHCR